jgi:hypothetical protein
MIFIIFKTISKVYFLQKIKPRNLKVTGFFDKKLLPFYTKKINLLQI